MEWNLSICGRISLIGRYVKSERIDWFQKKADAILMPDHLRDNHGGSQWNLLFRVVFRH